MRIDQLRNQKINQMKINRQNNNGDIYNREKADKISISQAAINVNDIKKDLATIPDVRKERVAALKARINSGTYNVSAEALAQRMLTNFKTGSLE